MPTFSIFVKFGLIIFFFFQWWAFKYFLWNCVFKHLGIHYILKLKNKKGINRSLLWVV